MMPSDFVALNALPLTSNGKVDRRALPSPEEKLTRISDAAEIPRTHVEQAISSLWIKLLQLKSAGIYDNFFEHGGHSLLAMQLVSKIRKFFDVEITLKSLFENPTIAGLAEMVESLLACKTEAAYQPIVSASREQHLPLSFAQQRLWFIDQLEPGSSFYNIPVAVQLSGDLNVKALKQTLEQIITRHEILRTTFAVVDGQPVQVIDDRADFLLPITDLTGLPQDERKREAEALAKQEASQPFDLLRGPLIRGRLVKVSEAEHVFLLTMHHIVSDGWSIGVMIREVGSLYDSYSKGEESKLEEMEIQYGDFAVWQREYLRGEVMERQMGYWRRQLEGAPTVLEMPVDRVRGRVQSYRGGSEEVEIGEELAEGLRRMSREEGATMFMTLLGAFAVLLMRYSGEEEVVVGTPIANRTRTEIEGLIGFFVNTLALRMKVKGEESFREILREVREVTMGGYANQDVPFEKVVEEVEPRGA